MTSPLESPVHERLWRTVPARLPLYCQVLIAGAGLSGCAAALAAARRGADVVVVEPTHMLGGQAGPAGVSAMDVTMYYDRLLNRHGIWSELRRRIRDYYTYRLQKSPNTSQYRDTSFSPNPVVVDRVLTSMLREAGVKVYRNVGIEKALLVQRVATLDTTAGTISGKVLIDATEDGLVTRLAKLPHRLGNTTFNGRKYANTALDQLLIQDITQTAMIRRHTDGAVPDALRLQNPPSSYNRYRHLIAGAYPSGPGKVRGDHPNAFAGYRGAPDIASDLDYTGDQWEQITRTSLNFHNDVDVRADFLVDAEARRRAERTAIERTLSVLYYLQVELGLPWAVATDEGFADGPAGRRQEVLDGLPENIVKHFPPIPYIRESIRLIGRDTVTGKTIFRRRNRTLARWDQNAVAVGTYPPDLHGGRRDEDLEADLGETLADKPSGWREGPFPIPLGALVPRDGQAFIAAEKNISGSRIAVGATRLHPTVTAIGEAAGVLAALSVERGALPHQIPTIDVQYELAAQGAHLAPLTVRGLPDDDADYPFVQLAVARQLVDWEIPISSHQVSAPEIVADLPRAARLGRALVDASRESS